MSAASAERDDHDRHGLGLLVRPRVCLAPCVVRAEVRVPRHREHRGLALVWGDEATVIGSSERALEGDAERVLFVWPSIELRRPGEYQFAARVWTARAICGHADQTVLVAGG
jgi:hypothetical protein